jgi:uncharacterized protein YjbI with pentapeptide repeats
MKKHKGTKGFEKSEIPPRDSSINLKIVREIAENKKISIKQLTVALSKHQEFLNAGGKNGYFQRLSFDGIPLNSYITEVEHGTQLDLSSINFSPKISLEDKELSFANLSAAIFECVDFSRSILDGTLLTDSFLQYATFDNSSLKNVDFTHADLRNVSFKNANLEGADFEIANLEGADFTGANLKNAVFPGANLKNVIH